MIPMMEGDDGRDAIVFIHRRIKILFSLGFFKTRRPGSTALGPGSDQLAYHRLCSWSGMMGDWCRGGCFASEPRHTIFR